MLKSFVSGVFFAFCAVALVPAQLYDFYEACLTDDYPRVFTLLKAGVNVQAPLSETEFQRLGEAYVDKYALNFANNTGQDAFIRNFFCAPLHLTVWSGNVDLSRTLLLQGALVDARDSDSWTPLMYAARASNIELTDLLMAFGANLDVADSEGITLLMIGASLGNIDLVNAILKSGAEVDKRDSQGWTACMIACQSGNAQLVQLFLDLDADANAKDVGGWTGLMSAVLMGYTEIVEILLQSGADMNAETIEGYTVFMMEQDEKMKNLLIDAKK